MKTWFVSLNGAIGLSFIAFLSGLGQLLLGARFAPTYILPPEDQLWQVAFATLLYLAFFGGWVWALLAAVRGRRGGLIAALIFSLLLALGWSGTSILIFCHGRCAAGPVGDSITWAGLISGLAAGAALGVQLRQSGRR